MRQVRHVLRRPSDLRGNLPALESGANERRRMMSSFLEVASKATPGPWFYRPDVHDDWGVIKTATGPRGFAEIVAIAKGGGSPGTDWDDYMSHREAKTDPFFHNAILIANAPRLLREREELQEVMRDLFAEVRDRSEAKKAGLELLARILAADAEAAKAGS